MRETARSERVLIVGGGISGLSIGHRLAVAGLPVTILESSRLGLGATTRNQGWLHSGGWFAAGNPRLARLCLESARQTTEFCPNCVELERDGMAFVFSREDSEVARWTNAWNEAGIPFEPWSIPHLCREIPGLDTHSVRFAFRLPDCAFRPDILLRQMALHAENKGAEIRCETPVTRILTEGNRVTGIQTGSGESLFGRIVILAGNAAGLSLAPAGSRARPGEQSEYTRVRLKTHLMSFDPGICRVPFCAVDDKGLNHLPHGRSSVLGFDHWEVVSNPSDHRVDPTVVASLTNRIVKFFPGLSWHRHNTRVWSGTTVQAMHVDQIYPGNCPWPTVIDHETESPHVTNLFSVFPGRATLWPQLAEMTRDAVLSKYNRSTRQVEKPPWEYLTS